MATKAEKAEIEKKRISLVLRGLNRHFPDPKCELDYETPYQLLIAVILSAQCTDVRVNLVTPNLFEAFPDAPSMAKATQAQVESLVKSTGFFRNKAKNIIGASKRIVEHFGGDVPQTMDDLLSLPGVARKTANCVLGECFGIACGVVVDTHVNRLSNLLGFTQKKDPKQIEKDLMAILPKKRWIKFAHQLILHGRRTCIARRPKCDTCFLLKHCPGAKQN